MDLKSSEPFWLVKNGLMNSYPSLREDIECDVLIVGGGITGALIAHQCVSDGYHTVLIDKREIGNGSSSATTSMLQYEIDVPLHRLSEMIGREKAEASYKACSSAIDRLSEIAAEIKSKAGFVRKESLYLATRKKDVAGLRKELTARADAGFDVEWLEMEVIAKRFGVKKGYGGILSRQGASVDAFCLLHELLAYNEKRGLRIFDKTELLEVSSDKKQSNCMLDTGAKIRTGKLVYCIGYESQGLIKEKFVDLLSTYAIVSEIDEAACKKVRDLLIWTTDEPYLYMRCTDDSRMLIGGGDEEFQDPVRRDALLTKKANRLHRSFGQLFPERTFYTDFSWTGTFGETKDGLPYIGNHQKFRDAYFVLGFGGNGITFSVIGMEMLSFWLKNRPHPLEELFAFGR
ncbi:Glycine/D-amino acid oxidase [Sphingobacterium nematocida]|uniref:Glycine/D-amino acid oxidase n=1 Tax=Sphingobacterium nematocida TaxID=1513896 RepID=A0A1T5AQV7_9SPHI|nr:FAD-binding oxidoreductase [Sphingobacterium nematocida]SKB37421.1 Glycine/D-amino acid oxidase [Sphingobacterium nematocida]